MNKAKQVASEFLSRDGKHHTTIDEDYRKPVTEEHVHPHRHEEVLTAVDRDVHQDHHHTTVQPVKLKESMPERHTHNVAQVEHKTFQHGNEGDLRATLDADKAKYRDSTTTHETTHSTSAAPALQGEHVHHHVHEHVQPVIMKKTHAPETVHTTVPIHETHHMAPTHHETTTLPMKTMEEFTSAGGRGTLHGRETETLFDHEGAPSKMGENFGYRENAGPNTGRTSKNMTTSPSQARSTGLGQEGMSHHHGRDENLISNETKNYGIGYGGENTGTHGRHSLGNEVQNHAHGENMGHNHADDLISRKTQSFGSHRDTMGTTGNSGSIGSTDAGAGGLGSTGTSSVPRSETARNTGLDNQNIEAPKAAHKPSMMDKLNPLKDSDGDGKKGFFS